VVLAEQLSGDLTEEFGGIDKLVISARIHKRHPRSTAVGGAPPHRRRAERTLTSRSSTVAADPHPPRRDVT
jgi:hypothetical protein